MTPSRRRWRWALLLAPPMVGYAYSGDRIAAREAPAKSAGQHREAKPITVTVARAVRREVVRSVAISGTLVAREEVLVGPQVEGVRIVALLADVGDRVKPGEVLARLDARALETQSSQNEAELAKARAEIAQARALLLQVEAAQAEAAAALKRAQTLERTGNVTAELLQTRDTAHQVAVARSLAQREAVSVAVAAEALVEARGREIVLKLRHTEVIAPDGGMVSRRSAHVGQIAAMSGEPLFRIIRDGEVELAAEVPEDELHLVAAGQSVSVSVGGQPEPFEGRVRLVTPTVDAGSRLGMAKVSLPPSSALLPGRFATGAIEAARRDGVVVPRAAVSFAPLRTSVQVVSAGTVSVRGVTLGLGDGDDVEITGGLAAGETVVARAGSFLRDGDRVTAQAEAPASLALKAE